MNVETIFEVTQDDYPMHTYLVEKGRGWLLGYRNSMTGGITIFKNPIKGFSKNKRKFKKVVDDELVSSCS